MVVGAGGVRADIAEVEVNPVRVAPDGALAVDALVTGYAGTEARGGSWGVMSAG